MAKPERKNPIKLNTKHRPKGPSSPGIRFANAFLPILAAAGITFGSVSWVLAKNKSGGDTPSTNICTVSFNVNGGPKSIGPATVKKGDKVNQPYVEPWVTPEGTKQVTSWELNGKTYDFNKPVESNITLKAVWAIVPPTTIFHTVTFKTDDETYQTEQIADGLTAIRPQDPTKAGHSFKYWSKDGSQFDFTTLITSDITLQAEWEEIVVTTHKITFYPGEFGKFEEEQPFIQKTCNDQDYFIGLSKPTVYPLDGYTHIGWHDASGKDLTEAQITGDINVYATYQIPETYVNLTLSTANKAAKTATIEVKGQDKFSWKEKDNKKYKNIKKGLPIATCVDTQSNDAYTYTFTNWSTSEQESFVTQQPEPDGETPIGSDTILYPQFKQEAVAEIVELELVLLPGQTIRSGSQKIEVPYKPGDVKTFGQVNKPEVFQGTKVFEGYYEDENFTTPWSSDTEIVPGLSNKKIYIKMVDVLSEPEVTFAVEDSGHESEYKWIGNHENIKCKAGSTLSSIAVPNVYYKDAKQNPDPTVGYSTNYYFDYWYYKNSSDKPVKVNNGFKINNSITLYAHFEKKTKVVIEIDEKGTKLTEVYALPSAKWKDIIKPEVEIVDKTQNFLIGWKSTDKTGDEFTLTNDTTISDILLDTSASEKETVHIIPIISNTVHTIEFVGEAVVDNEDKGTAKEKIRTDDIVLRGNTNVGVDKGVATPINSKVNKPTLPPSNDWDDPENPVAINKGLTFDNRWQIIGGTFTTWTDVTDETSIPAGDKTAYKMRPIIKENYTITYDKGEGQFVDPNHITTTIGPDSTFSSIFKPEVTIAEGKTFAYWATLDGEDYSKVLPTAKFTANTTLYAVYTTDDVQSTVNYHVLQSDIDDKDFPAVAINDTNCFTVAKTHKPNETVTLDMFAEKVPTKKKHHLKGWGQYDSSGQLVLIENPSLVKVIPGKPLDLYAIFEPDGTTLHKITIKEDPSKYTIDGPLYLYVNEDQEMPINDISNNIVTSDATISAWTVGMNLVGWETKDGVPLTSSTKITKDLEDIVPVFKAPEQQPLVKFVSPDGTVSDNTPKPIKINDTIQKYIDTGIWAPIAYTNKPRATFEKWQILSKDETTLSDITPTTRITNDMLVENTLTLVASFVDESIYEGIDGAYFYDKDNKKWAAIQSYSYNDDVSKMKIQYQDGVVTTIYKTDFNYEVKFGSQTTKIPDNFMSGCSNWNNGGKTLTFPSSVTSIGKNVMYGCSSFNQNVICEVTYDSSKLPLDPQQKETPHHVFTVGENFMKNCYSFDSDISISREGSFLDCYFVMSEGFMSECHSFGKSGTKELKLMGWQSVGMKDPITGLIGYSTSDATSLSSENFMTCLSTTMSNPYKIILRVSPYGEGIDPPQLFSQVLPQMDSELVLYHRNIQIKSI